MTTREEVARRAQTGEWVIFARPDCPDGFSDEHAPHTHLVCGACFEKATGAVRFTDRPVAFSEAQALDRIGQELGLPILVVGHPADYEDAYL